MSEALVGTEFELFLRTLDDERSEAAGKYLALRTRLERIFEWRGCENPEELADVVFDRVIKKIGEGEKIINVEAFCCSVAKFVYMEDRRDSLRKVEFGENEQFSKLEGSDDDESELNSSRMKCLEKCLSELNDDKRKLLVDYFDTDEATLIAKRQRLAESIGTNLNALRIRISRLKTKVEICTKDCCS